MRGRATSAIPRSPALAGCWRSPRGKVLSKQDEILVQVAEDDLGALRRALGAAMSHLDEARGGEERVPFADRLARLQEQAAGGPRILAARGDLHVLHRALHVAAGHVDDDLVRGPDGSGPFVRRLARLRRALLDAVCDHDDVPGAERSYD